MATFTSNSSFFSNFLNVIAPIALKPCALASLSCTKRKEAHDRLKTGKVSSEGKGRGNNVDVLGNLHQNTFSYRIIHTFQLNLRMTTTPTIPGPGRTQTRVGHGEPLPEKRYVTYFDITNSLIHHLRQ